MTGLSRSTALKIAAALMFLNGLFSVIFSTPLLTRGEAMVEQSLDAPPYSVVIAGFVLAIVMLIAAYGTWMKQRWGIVLALVTNAVGALLAAPGILFAPTSFLWIAATASVLLSVITIVLCLWRDRKSALA
jgi:hypothetical protein